MENSEVCYYGKNLSVFYEEKNDCFVQRWTSIPVSIEGFKNEMLEYLECYKKFKPIKSMWIQKNFTLELDELTFKWIEEYINVPCKKLGNEKLAFVVGKDLIAHLGVIDAFEQVNSCITPLHFANEVDARQWLHSPEPELNNISSNRSIIHEGLDENGDLIIRIKTPSKEVSQTLKSLKGFVNKERIFEEHQHLFNALTKREKEVLILLSRGNSFLDISANLAISENTTRTHWKNVKSKLDILHFNDVLMYVNTFC